MLKIKVKAPAKINLTLKVGKTRPDGFHPIESVMTAIDPRYEPMGDFELVDELSRLSETKVPGAIEEIRSAEVIHKRVCDRDQMQATVEEILGM